MPESRLAFLGDLFRPWSVRIWLGTSLLLTFLGNYGDIAAQFPSLHLPVFEQLLITVGAFLPPWWGWVIILFVYALFEYVRSRASATATTVAQPEQGPVAPISTPEMSQRLEAEISAINNRLNDRITKLERLADDLPAPAPPPEKKKSRREILGAWAHVDQFKVSDAACLWAGYLPGGSYDIDRMQKSGVVGAERLISTELETFLDTREVRSFDGDMRNAYVKRAHLVWLAEKKKVMPGFLYPDG